MNKSCEMFQDRNESGRVGLPGGKLDNGESPLEALKRECKEEGWEIEGISKDPAHIAMVDGKVIHWYRVNSGNSLENYKEKGRISPILLTREAVLKSGYGNKNLKLS